MKSYLQKQSLFPPLIKAPPHEALSLVVVIPCFNEKELLKSLESLKNCKLNGFAVEVIVVINDGENALPAIKKQNAESFDLAEKWANDNNTLSCRFHILYQNNLPKKHAGVGLARKIGMDEAVRRLESAGRPDGVIACFDADSICREDYFMAIEKHFRVNIVTQAAGIHFEHPLEGDEFEPEIYKAILAYEFHLRYFIHAQRYAGFPHAIQTIGSSMAVRCNAYQQQGGMNRRKAGEDFYFIHKFAAIGKHSEITDTIVYPSPRISDRVPFGTGKAVGEIIQQPESFQTYAPVCFEDLKIFLEKSDAFFGATTTEIEQLQNSFPDSVKAFLVKNDFVNKLLEIQQNSTNPETFRKRFYRWFNAFLLMKYVHFARDNFYPNVGVGEAGDWLFRIVYNNKITNLKDRLLHLRLLDRENKKGQTL